MNLKKNALIVIIIFTGFVFGVSFATLYAQTNIEKGTACMCTLPIPLLIPVFSSLGVFVGSIVYYFMFPRFEEVKEKSLEIEKILLDLLNSDERKIIEKIIQNKGKIIQSKLSSEFGKVKVFRIIESLKKRGIIEKEPYGKTNIIKLSEKFGNILNP